MVSFLAHTADIIHCNFLEHTAWAGDDYPNSLESVMGQLGKVALTLEDSFHYTPDGPHADAEWWSIYPGSSQGFVYLGPQRRFFGVSVFHQIHCLVCELCLGVTTKARLMECRP